MSTNWLQSCCLACLTAIAVCSTVSSSFSNAGVTTNGTPLAAITSGLDVAMLMALLTPTIFFMLVQLRGFVLKYGSGEDKEEEVQIDELTDLMLGVDDIDPVDLNDAMDRAIEEKDQALQALQEKEQALKEKEQEKEQILEEKEKEKEQILEEKEKEKAETTRIIEQLREQLQVKLRLR